MSYFQIHYSHDDCFYEVVSPIGVVVTRCVSKEQAQEFIEQTLRGVIEEDEPEEDTLS
jgi:hypothetical protein